MSRLNFNIFTIYMTSYDIIFMQYGVHNLNLGNLLKINSSIIVEYSLLQRVDSF